MNKLVKKNELISIKDRANKKITDKKISDFEKVQHMRVKMLNEGSEEPEGFDGYLLMKDLKTFQDKIKSDFHDTKVKFRSVYNDLRTKEHRVFANLEMERGQERNEEPGAAYAKIEVEKAMIKERLARAGASGKALEMSEDSEEPSEEEQEEPEEQKEDNEATEIHMPKVGGSKGMPPLPGGLPRPPQ